MSSPPTRDSTSSDEPTRAAAHGRGRGTRIWIRDIAIGTTVAILGAVGAQLIGLLPGLFGGEEEPRGSLTITQTLHNQTLPMFRREVGTAQPNEERGFVLEIKRHATDVPRNGCRLRWTYQDADGPRDVEDLSLVEQPVEHVTQDATSCSTDTRVWVPLSPRLEPYERIAVKLELLAGDRVIGSDVSESFTRG